VPAALSPTSDALVHVFDGWLDWVMERFKPQTVGEFAPGVS
jgi:hypothetical protein